MAAAHFDCVFEIIDLGADVKPQRFADEVWADFYAPDATGAVNQAKGLVA